MIDKLYKIVEGLNNRTTNGWWPKGWLNR